VPIDIN